MAYAYDDQNVFAKILRGEIPNDTVFDLRFVTSNRRLPPMCW